jgi:glycosyltransferase involved in cell wall biosynthesis
MTHNVFGQEKLWSILICTLRERAHLFNRIYYHLEKQINDLNLQDHIEIIYFSDNREHTVGFKRNTLMHKAQGKYICFIDDDDMVSNDYIQIIYEKLLKDPDCVSLIGKITMDGRNPRTFIHSIKYSHYFQKDRIYYRPPNHLNPIRKSIALQFKFLEINSGEDTNWAMAIARSQLLQKEEVIDKIYYYYFYITK